MLAYAERLSVALGLVIDENGRLLASPPCYYGFPGDCYQPYWKPWKVLATKDLVESPVARRTLSGDFFLHHLVSIRSGKGPLFGGWDQ